MKHKKYYDIVQEILEAFKIETLPREIDIDGMAEDMCTADDATQIRMIGIFLYFAVYGDERCSDIGNLSMFCLTLLPLPEDISEYSRQQRMVFLNNFSRQQIRLILFVIMKLAENKILDSETEEFINFWTIRYLDVN